MFFFHYSENKTENIFDSIRHINEYGVEFWYARELQTVLEYKRWDKFNNVIDKSISSCKAAGNDVFEHFSHVGKTSPTPNGGERVIDDYMLSRYACYLIAMNGDPRKEIIAQAQTYFAVQTRRQELQDEFDQLTEDQKRLAVRNELKEHNKSLAAAAHDAGVTERKDYAIFQNFGYKGLYGGLGQKEIHKRKGLKDSQDILDFMGSTELAANLFRATQTDEKLRRENIQGKDNANRTHYEVGAKVRQTIKELGGTMPEDLPTPDKSVKKIEHEEKKRIEGK